MLDILDIDLMVNLIECLPDGSQFGTLQEFERLFAYLHAAGFIHLMPVDQSYSTCKSAIAFL